VDSRTVREKLDGLTEIPTKALSSTAKDTV